MSYQIQGLSNVYGRDRKQYSPELVINTQGKKKNPFKSLRINAHPCLKDVKTISTIVRKSSGEQTRKYHNVLSSISMDPHLDYGIGLLSCHCKDNTKKVGNGEKKRLRYRKASMTRKNRAVQSSSVWNIHYR